MEENNKILIYTDNDGLTKIDVKLEEDTLWLTQAQMCELYQTSKSNVSEHIKHIFEEGELQEDSVVRKFRTTATDGKSYMTTFYNLDMIIALLDFAERQAEKEQPMTMIAYSPQLENNSCWMEAEYPIKKQWTMPLLNIVNINNAHSAMWSKII